MPSPISRRDFLKLAAVEAAPTLIGGGSTVDAGVLHPTPDGWVRGKLTGAMALVKTLQAEGAGCVFGIPGAQENELWDAMKQEGLPYLLAMHEFAAAGMADGYARATGRPGVLCIVPGPGVTNALSGLGEALLDSVPIVCIAGDVARGEHYRAFQVHDLPNADLLRPVCKKVIAVDLVEQIPDAVRQAFQCAAGGEPGPVGVVVPYDLLTRPSHISSGPIGPPPVPFDGDAFELALALLSNRKHRIGLYAGLGCMDASPLLIQVAEMLQAPVATTVSGKGVIPESHPLAVGWGYGPQGTRAAEHVFKDVDLVLAIGARYSEVSTAFYSIPKHKHLIQVDINPANLGAVVHPELCVNADAGLFLQGLLDHSQELARPHDGGLSHKIAHWKSVDLKKNSRIFAECGADPVAFLFALRRLTCDDAMTLIDVTMTEHWAAEMYDAKAPRTYFNPTDNQSMGWSIPAAIGAQVAYPGRQTVTVTGDGCFFMSAMELANAARACIPIKVFVLDDQAYHYMQAIQKPAYLRTTATVLPRLDYRALAEGFGVGYGEILSTGELEAGIQSALSTDGPVLTRVMVDYRKRPVRWIEATKSRYIRELSTQQKLRFLARLSGRAVDLKKEVND